MEGAAEAVEVYHRKNTIRQFALGCQKHLFNRQVEIQVDTWPATERVIAPLEPAIALVMALDTWSAIATAAVSN